MDELLERHVKQLREIDERLERIVTKEAIGDYDGYKVNKAIRELRRDLARMIDVAHAESDAF